MEEWVNQVSGRVTFAHNSGVGSLSDDHNTSQTTVVLGQRSNKLGNFRNIGGLRGERNNIVKVFFL